MFHDLPCVQTAIAKPLEHGFTTIQRNLDSTEADSKKQLINHIVDGWGSARPETLFAELPISVSNISLGSEESPIANAINGLAW